MSVRGEAYNTKMSTDVKEEEPQSTLSWVFSSIVSGVKNFNDTLTDFVQTIDIAGADTDADEEEEGSNEGSNPARKQGSELKQENQEDLVQPLK